MTEDLFKKDRYNLVPFVNLIWDEKYEEIQKNLGVSDMKDEDLLVFIIQSMCDQEYKETMNITNDIARKIVVSSLCKLSEMGKNTCHLDALVVENL